MFIPERCVLAACLGIGALVLTSRFPHRTFKHESRETLPLVIAASAPVYPRTPLLAHIEGTVKLRVTTDGKKVSSLDAESGPPMLLQATEENIWTWQFEDHKPTHFPVTFEYKLVDKTTCSVENGTIVLRLPAYVEISAKRVTTCDPVSRTPRRP
jgi:hypothetical protein